MALKPWLRSAKLSEEPFDITSNSSLPSTPARRAMASASASACPVMNSTMLLRIFTTCPAPCPPQWFTSVPMQERYGRNASHASPGPPTMMLKVPSRAAWRVRATGASRNVSPRAASFWPSSSPARARRGEEREPGGGELLAQLAHQLGRAGAHVDDGVDAPAGLRDAAKAEAHLVDLAPARQ